MSHPSHLRNAAFALISVGLLAESRAQILFSVDTASELTGSFSEAGFSFSQAVPVTFAFLPAGGAQTIYAARFPNNMLKALGTGTPDNPSYNFLRETGPATLSGTYSNGGAGGDQEVTWSFYNMHDDGSTFTGNFSFALVAVPEPAEIAGVSALGLAAFAVIRRRRMQK